MHYSDPIPRKGEREEDLKESSSRIQEEVEKLEYKIQASESGFLTYFIPTYMVLILHLTIH